MSDWFGMWWIMIWRWKFGEVMIGIGEPMENFFPDKLQETLKRFGPFYIQIWKGTIITCNE